MHIKSAFLSSLVRGSNKGKKKKSKTHTCKQKTKKTTRTERNL